MSWRYTTKRVDPDAKGATIVVWDHMAKKEAPVGRFPNLAWAKAACDFMNTADSLARDACPEYAALQNKRALDRARVE